MSASGTERPRHAGASAASLSEGPEGTAAERRPRAQENERELKFRDPARGAALAATLAKTVGEIGRAPVSVMHVCGSHEQAIARFGLRTAFPPDLHVIMGPGCPVCITDQPEVDEGVALARQRVRLATYGDMRRCPGSAESQADAL